MGMKQTHLPVKGSLELMYALALLTAALMAAASICQAGRLRADVLFAGLSEPIDLKLISRLEFGSGAVAMRYEPRR